MTTEQLNEARNRPWADAEAIRSGSDSGRSTIGRRMQPRPPSRSAPRRGQRWPVVLLLAGAAVAVLVLMWGRHSGQLEVTIERKRSP